MGTTSVVSYLGQLLKGQEHCYRLKLMFVGQENVGYVCVCCFLVDSCS
jgi:hypothetical protein